MQLFQIVNTSQLSLFKPFICLEFLRTVRATCESDSFIRQFLENLFLLFFKPCSSAARWETLPHRCWSPSPSDPASHLSVCSQQVKSSIIGRRPITSTVASTTRRKNGTLGGSRDGTSRTFWRSTSYKTEWHSIKRTDMAPRRFHADRTS